MGSGLSKVNEATIQYRSLKPKPQVKDFNYTEFRKIADKAPFSQAEWATMLHISERTLQRYAKSNSSFAAINAERAVQIDKILKEARKAFGSAEKFYQWLKRNPPIAEGNISLESLQSLDGIEKILTQLGRIQHGLFA